MLFLVHLGTTWQECEDPESPYRRVIMQNLLLLPGGNVRPLASTAFVSALDFCTAGVEEVTEHALGVTSTPNLD